MTLDTSAVEKLLMTRAKAVENLLPQIFFPKDGSSLRIRDAVDTAFASRFA
jgi:hypothetical protein